MQRTCDEKTVSLSVKVWRMTVLMLSATTQLRHFYRDDEKVD